MTWVRLDDGFPQHRKIRRLTDAAFRLHISGLCWASKYLTDGAIAEEDLVLIAAELDDMMDPQAVTEAVERLVDRGVWHLARHDCPACPTSKDGWVIHDYLAINPSADQVRKQRESATERQRRSRERRLGSQGDTGDDGDRDSHVTHTQHMQGKVGDVTDASQRPTPTPIPKPSKSKHSVKDAAGAAFDREFEEDFWPNYPRKVGKAAALKAFRTARKTADLKAILDGLTTYAKSAKDQDARFIAHAATWLNGHRWEDEPDRPDDEGGGWWNN